MLAHRIFDHRLICGDDECGAIGEYEQADRFERLDGGVGKAAIEIVDQHDQLVNPRSLQQACECFPKGLDLLRHVLRLGRLQKPLHAVDGLVVIFFGRELGGIGEDALHGVDDGADLVGCRNARHGRERQTAAVARDLEPIDPAEDICDRRPRLRQQRALLEQTGDDALDQRDLGVLETLEPPSIELETEDAVLVRKTTLDHLEDAGLPSAPIAVNANRHWALRLLPQQRDDGLGDRFVVKEIDLRFVVGQYHSVSPRSRRSCNLATTNILHN